MRRLTSIAPLVVVTLLAGVFGFAATAHAQGVAIPSDSSLIDFARPLYEAFAGGHYAFAASMLVVVVVAAIKRYFGDKYKWLHSDAGGASMALVGATALAMASGLAAPGAVVTWALLKSALLVGVGAAGGYAVLKHLFIDPLLQPLHDRVSPWAQRALRTVLWIFDQLETVVEERPSAQPGPVPYTPATPAPAPAPEPPKDTP